MKRTTKTAVLVGDRGSGKSTILQAFLNKSAKRESSSPIEYNFGRKASFTNSSKELAHLYEIGGGRPFADLIQIPINPEHYANTVIIIVLDLSKVSSLLDSLTFWLDTIRKIIPQRSFEEIPEDSLKGIINKVWGIHEDRKYIDIMPIPILVVANKYDKFIKEDP